MSYNRIIMALMKVQDVPNGHKRRLTIQRVKHLVYFFL